MANKKAALGTKTRKSATARAKKTSTRVVSHTMADSSFENIDESGEALGLSRASTRVIRETSYRLAIPAHKLEVAVAAARLKSEAFGVVETLVRLNQSKSRQEMLARAARSIIYVLEQLVDEDPLAEVDEAADEEVLQGQLEAEIESRKRRETLLASCVGVEEAAELADRSRQRLEKLRREGKLLALRVKNHWRYPRWQFDADLPSGVLPGLEEVVTHLQLSPAGSAAWLAEAYETLGNHTPIQLLKTGQIRKVIELAEEHGHMP